VRYLHITVLAALLVACGTNGAGQPTTTPASPTSIGTIQDVTPTTAPEPMIAPATAVLVAIPTDAPTIEPTAAPQATDTPAPTVAVIETPTIVTEPSMPPQPYELPPSFVNCQDDPNFGQAPNYLVLIVKVNKDTEVVTLKNVSPDAVSLDSWHMCSIKGNQQHPISGSLAADEQKDFPGPDASIWSNSDDPGALYDSEGRLVSYWRN
jgi:hypothetical protein